MDPGRLISRQPLANGLSLELWDHSRPVAGDRWYVCLETRIAIPVGPDTLPPDLKPEADQIVAALGAEIIFSQKETRNFIAASEFPGLLQDMQNRILAMAPGYFGHEQFAPRFIRKTFMTCQRSYAVQGRAPGREH